MPISEGSYRFIQLVLSIHSSELHANLIWLQHGVVIRGDQRRPSSSNPEDYVVHDVILWDPLSVSLNLTLCCPNCLECSGMNQSLRATRWKDGRTKCDEPRRLYDLTNNVLLVSRVYVCDRRHQIIAHDPSVLSQVKGILPILFLLFHKAGVMRELHSFIISHANAGLTISEIQMGWVVQPKTDKPIQNFQNIGLSSDMVGILNSIVSDRQYGMLRGQIHTNLPCY